MSSEHVNSAEITNTGIIVEFLSGKYERQI